MTKQQRNDYLKAYREKNRLKLRKRHRLWYLRNKHREDLKVKRKELWESWYDRNKDWNIERAKFWRLENPERVKINKRNWNVSNPEKYRKMRKREMENISARIAGYMRTRLRLAMLAQHTWKRGKTLELLGCSIKELKLHLEKQFKDGMSWDNYGKWHIDHIRPLSNFDLFEKGEQLKACNFINLRPLWAIDNLKKGKKY